MSTTYFDLEMLRKHLPSFTEEQLLELAQCDSEAKVEEFFTSIQAKMEADHKQKIAKIQNEIEDIRRRGTKFIWRLLWMAFIGIVIFFLTDKYFPSYFVRVVFIWGLIFIFSSCRDLAKLNSIGNAD